MTRDEILLFARLLMQAVGGVLIYRGVGDAALWEAMGGLAVCAVGVVLSWRSRKALRDQVAEIPAKVRNIAAEALGRK